MNESPILEFQAVTKSFGGAVVLNSVDATFASRKVTALLGPNGAGKTTLLNLCSGFIRPDSGQIEFRGQNITGFSPYRIARLGIGRTFQTPRVFLNLTVLENLLLALNSPPTENLRYGLNLFRRHSDAPLRARALSLLQELGLHETADRHAYQLSYGQLKLLQLARTALLDSAAFLLDEPTAGLFPALKHRVLAFLRRLAEHGSMVLLIEHNLKTVRDVAELSMVLNQGRLIAKGPTGDVLNSRNIQDLLTNDHGRS